MSRMFGRDGLLSAAVKPACVLLLAGICFVAVPAFGAAADEKADKPDKAEKPEKPEAKDAAAAAEKVTFAKDIQPLMKESCTRCHGAPKPGGGGAPGGPPPGGPGGPAGGRGPGGPGMRGPAGGLRLDDRAQILKGGKHGKAVVAGKAEQSLLYKVLKDSVTVGKDEIHAMPKSKPGEDFTPMADDQIELIKHWIDQGAK